MASVNARNGLLYLTFVIKGSAVVSTQNLLTLLRTESA